MTTSTSQRDREIRVFISSTFMDMDDDREVLVKDIFPRLRRLCEERGLVWADVDLRWGITEDQVDSGEFLSMILGEIELCSHFVGVMGERYGTVPDDIPEELFEQYPWLLQYPDRSITEIEILHGALNRTAAVRSASFYFRDPSFFVDRLPQESRDGLAERSVWNRAKLASLKERIRRSDWLVHENYRDPQELGKLVLEDLSRDIRESFPEAGVPDALARERAMHETFWQVAGGGAGCYIERQEYFDRLDAHAAEDREPLAVVAESGSGKSALLANWVTRYRKVHPADILLVHFVAASNDSADWAAMLHRLMGELSREFTIPGDSPDEEHQLRSAFANWLRNGGAQAADRSCRIILVIDGVDQLDDRAGALDLVWLPRPIPPGVSLIVSTLPGRSLAALSERGSPALTLQPLTLAERKEFINRYLGHFGKQLGSDQTERITGAPAASNPLYLRLLLDEFRVVGARTLLNERIEHCLAASDTKSLYEIILDRYEKDYEKERPGLVRDAMSMLWAARRGLSETELLQALSDDASRLPSIHWSPLHLALGQSLVRRSGLIALGNDSLREAVLDRYLFSSDRGKSVHARLAICFQRCDNSARKAEELPWHLVRSESWEDLYKLLSDMEFLETAYHLRRGEIRSLGLQLEASSPWRLLDAFQPLLLAPENLTAGQLWLLASLLTDMGHGFEALPVYDLLLDRYRQADDLASLAATLQNRASPLVSAGRLDEALGDLQESEQIARDLNWQEGVSGALGKQAHVHSMQGDDRQAFELYKQQGGIDRERGNLVGMAMSLHSQAALLLRQGELGKAQKLVDETKDVLRRLGHRGSAWVACLLTQSNILRSHGRFAEAAETLRELAEEAGRVCNYDLQCKLLGSLASILMDKQNQPAEGFRVLQEASQLAVRYGVHAGSTEDATTEAAKRGLPPDSWLTKADAIAQMIEDAPDDLRHLAAACGRQAMEFFEKGEFDHALELLDMQENVSRMTGDDHHLQMSLGDRALMLTRTGEHATAMRLLRERETICRRIQDLPALAHCIGGQSIVAENQGDFAESLRMLENQEEIYRELNDLSELSATIHNQALTIAERMKRPPSEAIPFALKACKIARQSGNIQRLRELEPFAVALSARTQDEAFQCHDRNDSETARRLFGYLEQLARVLDNPDLLFAVLGNQSLVLREMGELDIALKLLDEQEGMCRSAGKERALLGCLGNRALVLKAKRDFRGALGALDEREALCRALGDRETLALSYGSRGQILAEAGDTNAAITAHQEEERICREMDDRSGLERSWLYQMEILKDQADIQQAITVSRRQEEAYRDWNDRQGLAVNLYHRALLLSERDDMFSEALSAARESHQIAAELQLHTLMDKAKRLLAAIVEGTAQKKATHLEADDLRSDLYPSRQQERDARERVAEHVRREIVDEVRNGEPTDYETARERAQSIDDVVLEASVVQSEGISLLRQGRLDVAIGRLSLALRMYEQAGEKHAFLMTCNLLGEAYRNSGEFTEARRWFERSRECAVEQGTANSLAVAGHNLGALSQSEGALALEAGSEDEAEAKFREAEDLIRASLAHWQESHDQPKEARALGQLGRLFLIRRDLEQAEDLATQAMSLRETMGNTDVFIDYNTLGEIAQARGNREQALKWFRKRDEAEASRQRETPGGTVFAIGDVAEACVNAGLRGLPEIPSQIENALKKMAETGPPMDRAALFLRQLAAGDFPDRVSDDQAIFQSYFEELLERAKKARLDGRLSL